MKCRYAAALGRLAKGVKKNLTPEERKQRGVRMRAGQKLRWIGRLSSGALADRKAARIKLKKEVKAGRIQKLPCETCGSIKSEAHHGDYSKPLVVRWVCRKHHAAIHARALRKARKAISLMSPVNPQYAK